MSKSPRSYLKRLKDFNVKKLMTDLRRNEDFMKYFPNIFMKKDPPADYFWRVYSALFPDDFNRLYNASLNRVMRRIKKPTVISVDHEAHQILKAQKRETIRLLMELDRPGVSSNISYLKKTGNRQQGCAAQRLPCRRPSAASRRAARRPAAPTS